MYASLGVFQFYGENHLSLPDGVAQTSSFGILLTLESRVAGAQSVVIPPTMQETKTAKVRFTPSSRRAHPGQSANTCGTILAIEVKRTPLPFTLPREPPSLGASFPLAIHKIV